MTVLSSLIIIHHPSIHETPSESKPRAPYFFPKNDMMFPCPAFAAGFFALDAVVEDCTLDLGGATGSSSEKDSQTGSSFVTGFC
jgi:hypothetical protein